MCNVVPDLSSLFRKVAHVEVLDFVINVTGVDLAACMHVGYPL